MALYLGPASAPQPLTPFSVQSLQGPCDGRADPNAEMVSSASASSRPSAVSRTGRPLRGRYGTRQGEFEGEEKKYDRLEGLSVGLSFCEVRP